MGNRAGKVGSMIVAGLLVVTLGGCSDSDGDSGAASSSPSASATSRSGSAAPSSGTVASASTPLGTVLVDGDGRTLYLWEADSSGKSACNGDCAKAWPPLTVSGKPVAGKGVQAGLLGTTTRADGSKEVTYNGHPLYHYAGDTSAGDTNGQGSNGFGAAWYVVGPTGNKITKPAPSASSSSPSSGTGGY
ncbi:hypothetical protein AB0N93_27485 [Streptomyces sp. NPDC091267]|uniref:COG4315 family predicted lipoprotein n=1 Tax=Streptomyces sp. NPDC091267 TaxID=3155195 RepID=UPI003422CF28